MEENSSLGVNNNSIDNLPDEVLISILSLLSLEEAARTSVLARRWRHVWAFSPILDFEGPECEDYWSDCDSSDSENFSDSDDSESDGKLEKTLRFVGWVNSVLNVHARETIDEFRVSFNLDNSNANDIDTWIKFAFTKRVKRLELNMKPANSVLYKCGGNGKYAFPNVYDPKEQLRILPPLGLSTCESLVTLHLTGVRVTREGLEFFVSNCPFLEELHVKNAQGFKSLRCSCKAIRLRILEIISCRCRKLEICSPNLVSCAFTGFYITMTMKDVSSLIDLSLGTPQAKGLSNKLLDISGCFSGLEMLALHTTTAQDDEGIQYPDLPRLKKLVLEIHDRCDDHGSLLGYFTPLINAAPLLYEIVLKLSWDSPWMRRSQTRRPEKGQKYQCLQVFEIVGFRSDVTAVEVALYVLEIAVSLEKMIINGKTKTGEDVDLLKQELASSACFRDEIELVQF